jgi:hypothetical protein
MYPIDEVEEIVNAKKIDLENIWKDVNENMKILDKTHYDGRKIMKRSLIYVIILVILTKMWFFIPLFI